MLKIKEPTTVWVARRQEVTRIRRAVKINFGNNFKTKIMPDFEQFMQMCVIVSIHTHTIIEHIKFA